MACARRGPGVSSGGCTSAVLHAALPPPVLPSLSLGIAMSRLPAHVLRPLRLAVLLLVGTACTDRGSPLGPEEPTGGTAGPAATVAALDCTASPRAETMSCAPAVPGTGGAAGDIIVGGQNVYVRLSSANVAYDGGNGQFTMDVTLENLIEQTMGTTDGVSLAPGGIRVFFNEGPTVTAGTGTASVNPDGFAFFLSAAQAYYQFDHMLAQGAASAQKGWTFIVQPTVETFTFRVYVSAPVQFPDGYVTLNGLMPGASAGTLAPGANQPLTAVVKTAVGNVLPGETVTFGTSDADCAAVDAGTGTVTGVRAATCTITATAGIRGGSVSFDVTGTTRHWSGAISTDWDTGGNWVGGYTPATVDSVLVPAAPANQPALAQGVEIAGVAVEDGATLSLGAHVLTAQADVATGPTPGSGILGAGGELLLAGGGTVHGRVPSLRVTGSYGLGGDLVVVAPETIDAGSLTLAEYEMQILSQ